MSESLTHGKSFLHGGSTTISVVSVVAIHDAMKKSRPIEDRRMDHLWVDGLLVVTGARLNTVQCHCKVVDNNTRQTLRPI